MVEIKRCPFCGEEAEIRQKTSKGALLNEYKIGCKTKLCPGSGKTYYKSKEQAIEKWNKRPNFAVGYLGNNLIYMVDGVPFMKSGVDINATNKDAGVNIPMVQTI